MLSHPSQPNHHWQEILEEFEGAPRTEAGRWSAALLVATLLVVSLFGVGIGYGARSSEEMGDNPYLVGTVVGASVLAAATAAAAAYAVAFKRERSWLAVAGLLAGCAVFAMGASYLL